LVSLGGAWAAPGDNPAGHDLCVLRLMQ